MGERKRVRMRALADGRVAITDPDPASLDLIHALDPSFRIRTAPLPGFVRPRLLEARAASSGIRAEELSGASDAHLWAAHDEALRRPAPRQADEASLLDVKTELAMRMLRHCELCALRCRVDRVGGERGRCGLGTDAFVYEAYVHIAEEPPINPALNVSLRGCGMRCIYCQQAPALDPRGAGAERLAPAYWQRLDLGQARSLVFIGGNPTESLPAVLAFLSAAPADFALPVGWNSSGYDSPEAIRLLEGVCDVWLPDFKYSNEECAMQLSEAPGYAANAQLAIAAMVEQQVPVFVRLLVLPGHIECCHEPALVALSRLASGGDLYVSVQGGYMPEWKVARRHGRLAGYATAEEVTAVRRCADDLGLPLVE